MVSDMRGGLPPTKAIALLKLAREIHAWDHAVVIDLAHLYVQTGQTAQALQLLDGALVHAEGVDLAEVRWAQFQATHSLRHLGLWLRLAGQRLFTMRGRSADAHRRDAMPDVHGEAELYARVP